MGCKRKHGSRGFCMGNEQYKKSRPEVFIPGVSGVPKRGEYSLELKNYNRLPRPVYDLAYKENDVSSQLIKFTCTLCRFLSYCSSCCRYNKNYLYISIYLIYIYIFLNIGIY